MAARVSTPDLSPLAQRLAIRSSRLPSLLPVDAILPLRRSRSSTATSHKGAVEGDGQRLQRRTTGLDHRLGIASSPRGLEWTAARVTHGRPAFGDPTSLAEHDRQPFDVGPDYPATRTKREPYRSKMEMLCPAWVIGTARRAAHQCLCLPGTGSGSSSRRCVVDEFQSVAGTHAGSEPGHGLAARSAIGQEDPAVRSLGSGPPGRDPRREVQW